VTGIASLTLAMPVFLFWSAGPVTGLVYRRWRQVAGDKAPTGRRPPKIALLLQLNNLWLHDVPGMRLSA